MRALVSVRPLHPTGGSSRAWNAGPGRRGGGTGGKADASNKIDTGEIYQIINTIMVT